VVSGLFLIVVVAAQTIVSRRGADTTSSDPGPASSLRLPWLR
jgi:hypothetical protein